MGYNGAKFIRKVMNRSGYIVDIPNVGDLKELIQSHPIDPYAESSDQLFPLGTKITQGERIWRHCKNGSATPAAGEILQGAAIQHASASLDIVVDAVSNIGDTFISLTSDTDIAVAADYYKEGYIFINVGAGVGHSYKIKKHDKLNSTNTGEIVTLYDGLVIATATSSSKCGLKKNPYDAVIVTVNALSAAPVGVAPLLLTASKYFWAQTGGRCAVIANASITIGTHVYAGTTAAKADPAITDVKGITDIGYAMTAPNTSNEAFLCFLTLDR